MVRPDIGLDGVYAVHQFLAGIIGMPLNLLKCGLPKPIFWKLLRTTKIPRSNVYHASPVYDDHRERPLWYEQLIQANMMIEDKRVFDFRSVWGSGLHFILDEPICVTYWLWQMGAGKEEVTHMAQVEFPEDAKVMYDDKSRIGKADKLMVHDIIPIADYEKWTDEDFCQLAKIVDPSLSKYIK